MTGQSVTFDRAAGYYDQTRGFPPGVDQPVAALMARVGNLTTDSRVLEVGIGTGRIAIPLAPYVRAYYGVDLARPMLDRMLEKQANEPIYPVIGDIKHLPFPDASFDAVIAVHIFHLVPGFEQALTEAARVLKPGGVLLHGWGQGDHESKLMELWNRTVEALGAQRQSAPGTMRDEQRETFLTDGGWTLHTQDKFAYTIHRAPIDHFNALKGRVYSRLWGMPDDIHAAGVSALEAYFADNNIDPMQPEEIGVSFYVQAFHPPVR